MKVLRLTRLIFGCMADVCRHRRCLAQAWRKVRRSDFPAVRSVQLWRWQKRLASALRTLVLAWECCIRDKDRAFVAD